jgi:hypothetical protein
VVRLRNPSVASSLRHIFTFEPNEPLRNPFARRGCSSYMLTGCYHLPLLTITTTTAAATATARHSRFLRLTHSLGIPESTVHGPIVLISNYCRRCVFTPPGTNGLLVNFPGRTLFFDSVSFAACGPCRSYFGHAAQFQTAERLILVLRRQLRHSTDRNPRSNALCTPSTIYILHTTYVF